MNNLKNTIKQNRIPLLITCMQWFITTVLQIDRAFFTYDYETKHYLIVKALYFVFLLTAWTFGFDVYKKIKSEDQLYKRGLQVFSFYFTIMMIILLILWPGTWTWDDLWTLNSICEYKSFNPWQHVITGIYQDVMLQILPFPGGIIFLQNIIASLCVSFFVTKMERAFNIVNLKNKFLDIFLKIIPFLLPPVLMYQFSGYRMGLYVYLELVVLAILISAVKNKKRWNWRYILLFCFLTIVVATWRTESFFYIPCSCLLILFINRDTLPKIKKIACILFLVIGFLGMNKFQSIALGDNNYQIISLLRPCAELVRAADYIEDAEELAIIDKVTDLKVIHDNPTSNGEYLYGSTGCVRNRNDNPNDDYTEEDYKNYLKAFIKLSLKYPEVVFVERWNLFIRGAGATGETVRNVERAAALFEADNGNRAAATIISKGWIANTPAFKKLRAKTINILGGAGIGYIKRILWNAMIPIIILVYAWIKLLIQRKWYYWFVCSAVLIRLPVVILTQPSYWFMYLLSFYFLGYIFLVYKLWIHYSKEKELEKNG